MLASHRLLLVCLFTFLLLLTPAVTAQEDEPYDPSIGLTPHERVVFEIDVEPVSNSEKLGGSLPIDVTVTNIGTETAENVTATLYSSFSTSEGSKSIGQLKPGKDHRFVISVEINGRSSLADTLLATVTADNLPIPAQTRVELAYELDPNERLGTVSGEPLEKSGIELRLISERKWREKHHTEPVLTFAIDKLPLEPVPLFIDLDKVIQPQKLAEKQLQLTMLSPEASELRPLDSDYDADANRLRFTPTEPGFYELRLAKATAVDSSQRAPANNTQEPIEGWTPTFHAPEVSNFNGTVSYRYPIETPPGPNGIQPSLAYVYSSGAANGLMGDKQADPLGFGWSLAGRIEVVQSLNPCHGTKVCEQEHKVTQNGSTLYNKYTLTLSGAGHELVHASGKTSNGNAGRYYAEGAASLYVEYCKNSSTSVCQQEGGTPSNHSGGFWVVKGADNTAYRLGFTHNSEQEVKNGRAHSMTNEALKWRIDRKQDRFGNQVTYSYLEDNHSDRSDNNFIHVSASYLQTISYGTGGTSYTINLTNTKLNTWEYGFTAGSVISWQTHQLTRIEIRHNGSKLRAYVPQIVWQEYGHVDINGVPSNQISNQSTWCARAIAYQEVRK